MANYTNSDAPLESDIADEHHELHNDQDDGTLPPRPTSRLGFNSTPTQEPVAPTRSRSGTLKWTRSLFQKIGIQSLASSSSDVDMDITAVPAISPSADDEDLDPLSLPTLPSLSSASASTSSLNLTEMDVDNSSSCDDEYDDSDSDGYSSSDSDIDLDSPADYGQGGRDLLLSPPVAPPTAPPRALPPSCLVPIPCPVNASTPPPFARRPTPVSPLSPSPLPRPKFSCLPSPLSPSSDDRIQYTNPLRHTYGHHGRSRHALLHLKYLWSLREEDWDAHAAYARGTGAYGGISVRPPSRRRSRCAPPVSVPPMTIHPRRGDLSALRDPYGAHMDRCFVGMPLWTMGKTLWMADVHKLTEGRPHQRVDGDVGSEDESESEGESMAASVSTAGFSDDSDETLVESESEGEHGMLEDVDLSADDKHDEKDAPVSPRSRPAYASPQRPIVLTAPPCWETNWYKRWELLIELVRVDTERERAQKAGLPPSVPCAALAVRPSTPRFFIGEHEDDGLWDEEQWDEMLGDDEMSVSVISVLEGH